MTENTYTFTLQPKLSSANSFVLHPLTETIIIVHCATTERWRASTLNGCFMGVRERGEGKWRCLGSQPCANATHAQTDSHTWFHRGSSKWEREQPSPSPDWAACNSLGSKVAVLSLVARFRYSKRGYLQQHRGSEGMQDYLMLMTCNSAIVLWESVTIARSWHNVTDIVPNSRSAINIATSLKIPTHARK